MKATLSFSPGTYREALEQYEKLKMFALYGGFCFAPVDGRINSPMFNGKSFAGGIVPGELIEQTGWSCSMDLDFNPAFLREIWKLVPPHGATLSIEV